MLILVALRDVTMAVLTVVLAQHNYGPLPVHFVGKTGTAVLMISIVGLMVADIETSDARVRNAALCGYLLCDLGA